MGPRDAEGVVNKRMWSCTRCLGEQNAGGLTMLVVENQRHKFREFVI